ncbi:AfsR/SARP family transcriptional regulator [Actinoplanes teichomyceticus]|uniref:AfsR/SARP family transcriptional regulator n=1 Tax=Actinoplanes teichomyceticus TaxID=1867 RepID=UPI0013DDD0A7|nr:AfsR/SARP family transcriptional regulator [Actinoplanes teichomyceticus]
MLEDPGRPPECPPPAEPPDRAGADRPHAFSLRLLGPVSLTVHDADVPLGGPKVAAVLTALALHANQWVSLDRLTAAVWGDTAPPSARVNLRGYAARVRCAMRTAAPDGDDRLTSGRARYRLRLDPGELDVDVFHALAEQARAALRDGRAGEAIPLLDRALALWHGEPAENVPRVPTIEPLLTALEERRLAVAEERLGALLARGEDALVVSAARAMLADHPDRERTWGPLILALYRLGDVAGALGAYGQARAGIARRLGIEPGPYLTGLHQMVLHRDPRLGSCAPAAWWVTTVDQPPAPGGYPPGAVAARPAGR